MSYRLLKIQTFYNEYISNYYKKFPNIINHNYSEQYQHIVNDSVEILSSQSKYLRKIGVDVIDIITNAIPLQKTWATEHNIIPKNFYDSLIYEQIKFYKPDIIWIDDTRLLNKKWINFLKRDVKSVKLFVGNICAPYNAEMAESFSVLDIIFTCSPCFQKELSSAGCNAILVYHSFDPFVLERINLNNSERREGFIFTGSLFTGLGLHKTRIEYIEQMLANGIGINIFGNLEPPYKIFLKQSMHCAINFLYKIKCDFIIDYSSKIKNFKEYRNLEIKQYSNKLIQSSHPPVFGIEMLELLSKSLGCFNIHGEVAKKCAANVRLFESTGVGTCLVTDMKENLPDLFDCESEIVTYKTMEECIEKIKWLSNNPMEALKIGLAGQLRTLKSHSIQNRIETINSILSKRL